MMLLQYTKSDVYAYQLLHYFITRYQYQMVRIQNQKKDFWLLNPAHAQYPVICISDETYVDEMYLRNVHRAILDAVEREGKLLLLNTNSSSTAFDREYVVQYPVPDAMKDIASAANFSGIEQAVFDVEDRQSECASLMRSLEEYEAQQLKKVRRNMRIRTPKVTAGIGILCIIGFAAVQACVMYFDDLATGLIASGAYYKMSVVAMKEYWRIFTTGFLHVDIFHLLMNLSVLYSIGVLCEKLYKPLHYAAIFLLSMWIGNMFAFCADGNILNVGIGGGIFGLTAAYFTALAGNGSLRIPAVRNSALRMGLLNLFLMMVPDVSMIGNVGAVAAGGFLGVMLGNAKRWKSLKLHSAISFVLLTVCLAFFAGRIQRVEPLNKELDARIIQGFEEAGWDGYAETMEANFQWMYEKGMVR